MKKKLLGLVLAAAIGLSVYPSTPVFATEPDNEIVQTITDEKNDLEKTEDEGVSEDKDAEDKDAENKDAENSAADETVIVEETKDENTSAKVEDEPEADDKSVVKEQEEVTAKDQTEATEEVTKELTEEVTEVTEATDDQNEEGFVVTFDSFEGGKIVAYDRKNFDEAVVYDDATTVVARNSDTGEVDTTGDGQVNFSVVIEDGYSFKNITITEGEGNYKNLKAISEEGNVYTYRITKITGSLRITVETTKLDVEGSRALLLDELDKVKSVYPVYYRLYCTEESASLLTDALNAAQNTDTETATNEDIQKVIDAVKEAIDALVYKTAEVPQVYISTKDGIGNNLSKKTGYVATSVVIADTDGTFSDEEASIKVRGNSTAIAEKKPFNIKLSSKQDLFGMGSSKKWCLLANCFDVTLMRNRTGLALAKELGVPYTSENLYVDLWVDGVYKGSYLLTEAVEAGSTRVDINVKSGDFILEIEKSRVEDGTTYITNNNGLRFSFKEPEEPTEEQYNHVKETLDRITAVVDSGDYSAVQDLIDIDSFARYYMVNEYMKNNDFNFSSAYFYFKDGKFYAGPAWDFDLSSGNGSDNYTSNKIPNAPWASKANWYPYLLKYSEFQKAVEAVFDEHDDYMANIAADGGFIDTTFDTYRASFERNFNEAGWEITKKYSANQTAPLPTLEENVEYYKNFLKARYDWMNKYYRNLVPNVWVNSVNAEDDGIKISWREEDEVDTYRVYRREGVDWRAISGLVKGNTYTDYTAEEGVQYYYDVVAVVDGTRGTLDYKGVPGTIEAKAKTELVIVKQPADVHVKAANEAVVFSVEATGKEVSYMWYVKTPDSDRFVKTGNDTTEYTRKMYAKNDGLQVYCVVSDAYGNKLTSNTATASFAQEFEIVKDTEDVVVNKSGDKATFRIEAKGKDVSYSWYYKMSEKAGGDGKFHKAGCYTNEYTRTASEKTEGMQAYCVVTDVNGNKYVGRTATLTIAKAETIVISYPNGTEIQASAGKMATFKVETVAENVSYSWYYKLPEQAGGDGKFHKAGNYTNEYSRTASVNKNGMQAYCVITDAMGRNTKSEIMTLLVK